MNVVRRTHQLKDAAVIKPRPVDSSTALGRFFPGSWNYSAELLKELPVDQRPCFLVTYHDVHELNVARSVEPEHCRVEYVYAGRGRQK